MVTMPMFTKAVERGSTKLVDFFDFSFFDCLTWTCNKNDPRLQLALAELAVRDSEFKRLTQQSGCASNSNR